MCYRRGGLATVVGLGLAWIGLVVVSRTVGHADAFVVSPRSRSPTHNALAFSLCNVHTRSQPRVRIQHPRLQRVTLALKGDDKDNGKDKDNDNGKDNDKDNDDKERRKFRFWDPTLWTVQDERLLWGDLLAVLVTAECLGFLDAVNDPSFGPNGGFAAPVPVVPSTLDVLVGRSSVMAIAWVLASLRWKGYSVGATSDPFTSLQCAVSIWLDHCSVRILLALLVAVLDRSPVDGFDLLRQLFFTLPAMATFRILYSQLYSL